MSNTESQGKRPGFLRRFWRTLWSPTAVFSLGFLVFGGIVAGILFWGGFNWAMEATNNEEFCVSCHEMRDNVFAEYQGTVHQNNSSGVRATCPDCHVPKEWGPKVVRKVQATWELYGHFVTGVIDSPEKFEEHRLEMATKVWKTMKGNDSHECRNCHNFEYMDFTQQEGRAAENHQVALDDGKTCIDCHQGVAHRLPDGYLEAYEKLAADMKANGEVPLPKGREVSHADVNGISQYLSDGMSN